MTKQHHARKSAEEPHEPPLPAEAAELKSALEDFKAKVAGVREAAQAYLDKRAALIEEHAEAVSSMVEPAHLAQLTARDRVLAMILDGLRDFHPDVVKVIAWLPGPDDQLHGQREADTIALVGKAIEAAELEAKKKGGASAPP